MLNSKFLDKFNLFVNIIKITVLFFVCILLISCGLTKTGTIADVNYHPNFFTGRAEVPVENGKTAKIILGREGPSNKVKVIDIKNKYIEKASARIEPITEKSKDKKVTVDVIIKGESKEVQIPEIIKKGYGGVLSLHLKKDIPIKVIVNVILVILLSIKTYFQLGLRWEKILIFQMLQMLYQHLID